MGTRGIDLAANEPKVSVKSSVRESVDKLNVEWLSNHLPNQKYTLTEELRAFSKYVKSKLHVGQLNNEEVEVRNTMLNEIEKIIQTEYPEAVLKQFGSYPLGLSNFLSDMDLSVDNITSLNNSTEDPAALNTTRQGNLRRSTAVKLLLPLFEALRRNKYTRNNTIIRHAKVPLIKVEHKCGVVVDISADSSKSTGARVVQSLLDRCGPALVDLSAFLKVYLHQRQLNEPFTGGLGSYGVYLLLTEHIQRNPQLVTGEPDLGALLRSFCSFYGQAKNLNADTVIRVEGADPFDFGRVTNVNIISKFFYRINKSFQQHDTERARGSVHTSYLGNVLDSKAMSNERRDLKQKSGVFLRAMKNTRTPPELINPLDKYLLQVEQADKSTFSLGKIVVESVNIPGARGGVSGSIAAGGAGGSEAKSTPRGANMGGTVEQGKRHNPASSAPSGLPWHQKRHFSTKSMFTPFVPASHCKWHPPQRTGGHLMHRHSLCKGVYRLLR